MNCEICEKIEKKEGLLFEGKKVVAILHPKPAAIGHIIVIPREHNPILEQIPDYVMPELFSVANKLSLTIFETLGAQGTNLLIQNGVAAGQSSNHAMIHVIPRRQNDGLNLLWQPKQVSEEQLDQTALVLQEQTKRIGVFEEEKEPPKEIKKEEKELGENEEFLKKELKRIP